MGSFISPLRYIPQLQWIGRREGGWEEGRIVSAGQGVVELNKANRGGRRRGKVNKGEVVLHGVREHWIGDHAASMLSGSIRIWRLPLGEVIGYGAACRSIIECPTSGGSVPVEVRGQHEAVVTRHGSSKRHCWLLGPLLAVEGILFSR